MSAFDPYPYIRDRLVHVPKEFVWTSGSDDSWKSSLRNRLHEAIGLTPYAGPLNPRTLDVESRDGYIRERLAFSVQDGLDMVGVLLVPNERKTTLPAVICCPGHGAGMDSLLEDGLDEYQHTFAVQCVLAGFVALAIEPFGFGHRKSGNETDRQTSCVRDSMAALMLGESMIGWRTQEAIRALDFLSTRKEVDPSRLAAMGISGGGLVAFWVACLDDRIAASVVSGYFNTFLDSILSIDHCVDNFAPGLARIVEMPDMVSLISPRRLFVESGSEDSLFPAESFLKACDRARQIFENEGVPDHFESHLFQGGHQFCGFRSIPRLRQWFGLSSRHS